MPHPPPWTHRVEVKGGGGVRRGRGEGSSAGESLTVSSVTVMGLGGAERRGGYHPTSSSFPPKLELICVNQCKLGEGLIAGTEAPPRAKLPNISIVGGEAGTRHTRMQSFNHSPMLVLSVRMLKWFCGLFTFLL